MAKWNVYTTYNCEAGDTLEEDYGLKMIEIRCSNCNEECIYANYWSNAETRIIHLTDYCPFCGSKMEDNKEKKEFLKEYCMRNYESYYGVMYNKGEIDKYIVGHLD